MRLHISSLIAHEAGGHRARLHRRVGGDPRSRSTATTSSRDFWARYTSYLDKTLRLLFMEGSSKTIVRWQLAVIFGVLAVHIALFAVPYWFLIIPAAIVGPAVWLAQERKKRIEKLEIQIDGFIFALANSMKTVPGPAAALQAVVPILQNPTQQEIERVVKEMRVGNTLEQSLVNMSSRIGSRAHGLRAERGAHRPPGRRQPPCRPRDHGRDHPRDEPPGRRRPDEDQRRAGAALGPRRVSVRNLRGIQRRPTRVLRPLQQSFAGYVVITIACTSGSARSSSPAKCSRWTYDDSPPHGPEGPAVPRGGRDGLLLRLRGSRRATRRRQAHGAARAEAATRAGEERVVGADRAHRPLARDARVTG